MKIILVDDEPDALKSLSILLNEYGDGVEVVGTCSNTLDAEKIIFKQRPDLVFMDIEMPGESGLNFIERLGQPEFEVVFATAYNQYAIQAFQLSALNYITKPFTAAQVSVTMRRAVERIDQKRNAERFAILKELLLEKPRRMVLNTGKTEEIVYFEQIICLKAFGHCTIFFLADGRKLTTGSNLGEYMDALVPQGFLRAHNSWAVNSAHVIRYHTGDNDLEMAHGIKVPLGRVYKEEVLKHLRG